MSLSIKHQPWIHHLYSLAGYLAVEFEGMRDVPTPELVQCVDRYVDAFEMENLKVTLEDDK